MIDTEILCTVDLIMFGIFHDYYPESGKASLQLSKNATLEDIKCALQADMLEKNPGLDPENLLSLLDSSAFVYQDQVIQHFCLQTSCILSVLPPVCGG